MIKESNNCFFETDHVIISANQRSWDVYAGAFPNWHGPEPIEGGLVIFESVTDQISGATHGKVSSNPQHHKRLECSTDQKQGVLTIFNEA